MTQTGAWFGLLILALLLIAAAFQGGLGRLVGIIFVPDRIVIE